MQIVCYVVGITKETYVKLVIQMENSMRGLIFPVHIKLEFVFMIVMKLKQVPKLLPIMHPKHVCFLILLLDVFDIFAQCVKVRGYLNEFVCTRTLV